MRLQITGPLCPYGDIVHQAHGLRPRYALPGSQHIGWCPGLYEDERDTPTPEPRAVIRAATEAPDARA